MSRLAEAIISALKGDVSAIAVLEGVSHDELREAFNSINVIKLSRDAIIRALESWVAETYSDQQIQCWASFMRRGYISSNSSLAIVPLDIQYDQEYEEDISQVISRLDELGDQIDGKIGDKERQDLLDIMSV